MNAHALQLEKSISPSHPNLTVPQGQITFNAEGSDLKGSLYFSRVIHWPGNNLSGVTIGRGYDMGNRNRPTILADMLKAGIAIKQAKLLADAAGLKGLRAKAFVIKNKSNIGEITHSQQINLFNLIYPIYELRAKKNYNKWTNNKQRVPWNKLHPKIRDVLVDFVYQGFTAGPRPMQAGMNNDFGELIKYIEKTPELMRYENGRGRVKYLKKEN